MSSTALCIFTEVWGGSGGTGRAVGGPGGAEQALLAMGEGARPRSSQASRSLWECRVSGRTSASRGRGQAVGAASSFITHAAWHPQAPMGPWTGTSARCGNQVPAQRIRLRGHGWVARLRKACLLDGVQDGGPRGSRSHRFSGPHGSDSAPDKANRIVHLKTRET